MPYFARPDSSLCMGLPKESGDAEKMDRLPEPPVDA